MLGAKALRYVVHDGAISAQQSEEIRRAIAARWHAFNITSDRGSGIGAWSDKEIADYSDIKAVVVYLRSVPPVRVGVNRAERRHGDDARRRVPPGAGDHDLRDVGRVPIVDGARASAMVA